MQKMNKYILYVLFLFLCCSCAHRSGQNKKNRASGYSTVSQAEHENHKQEVPKHKRSTEKMDGAAIFSKYNTAVFMVFTSDGTNTYQGSGFFISSTGLAVSNYHVFKGTGIGEEAIKLANSDTQYKVCEVIAKSEENDFIIFRINCSSTNYIPIASVKPKIGEKVYAIGSPRGLENTFSSGEVSQWRDRNLMQISALIDHGSSGGALINEYGEVVGITSGTFCDGSQANLNYAWSIDAIKSYIGD